MNVPKYDELMNPTLQALHRLGGSASIHELLEEIVKILNLPSEVTEMPHGSSGQTELEYRLGWTRTYLKNGGLITNSARGVWALTAKGLQANKIDPTKLKRAVKRALSQKKNYAVIPPDEVQDNKLGETRDTTHVVCYLKIRRKRGMLSPL